MYVHTNYRNTDITDESLPSSAMRGQSNVPSYAPSPLTFYRCSPTRSYCWIISVSMYVCVYENLTRLSVLWHSFPAVCDCGIIITPKLKNPTWHTWILSAFRVSDYCKSKFKTGVVLVGVFEYSVLNGETQTPDVEAKLAHTETAQPVRFLKAQIECKLSALL